MNKKFYKADSGRSKLAQSIVARSGRRENDNISHLQSFFFIKVSGTIIFLIRSKRMVWTEDRYATLSIKMN